MLANVKLLYNWFCYQSLLLLKGQLGGELYAGIFRR